MAILEITYVIVMDAGIVSVLIVLVIIYYILRILQYQYNLQTGKTWIGKTWDDEYSPGSYVKFIIAMSDDDLAKYFGEADDFEKWNYGKGPTADIPVFPVICGHVLRIYSLF